MDNEPGYLGAWVSEEFDQVLAFIARNGQIRLPDQQRLIPAFYVTYFPQAQQLRII